MANEGSTKPTYSELEAENLRVRGLLQRQWISVEERLPSVVGVEFWCWDIPLPVDECPLNTSGEPITPNLNWAKPHAEIIKTYATKTGEIRFNCGGLSKVTHWMPMPEPPNFPQSSELVSQGAESADIGKVDTADKKHVCGQTGFNPSLGDTCAGCEARKASADKSGVEMGKVNRVDEKYLHAQAWLCPQGYSSPRLRPWMVGVNFTDLIALLNEYGAYVAGSAETGGEKE